MVVRARSREARTKAATKMVYWQWQPGHIVQPRRRACRFEGFFNTVRTEKDGSLTLAVPLGPCATWIEVAY